MTVRLSRFARLDLDEIRKYTVETWGRDRWLKCYESLVQVFERISAEPDGERDRSLFKAGLRSEDYGRHAVFYSRLAAADNKPVIIRIVHQRRHLPALTHTMRISVAIAMNVECLAANDST